MVGERDRRS